MVENPDAEAPVMTPEGAVDPQLEHLADFVSTLGGENAVDFLKEKVGSDLGKYHVNAGLKKTEDKGTSTTLSVTEDEGQKEKRFDKLSVTKDEDGAVEEEADEDQSIFVPQKKKGTPATFTSVDDIAKTIEKKYGIKDPATFFESASKWKNDSQLVNDLQGQVATFQNMYAELPEELYTAIEDYFAARDWTQPLSQKITSRVDYNVPFEKQDLKKLVAVYAPDADIDEIDFENAEDPSVKVLRKTIARQFENDSKQRENKRADFSAKQEATVKAYQDAVNSSVASFTKTLPSIRKEQVSKVTGILKSGDPASGIFYDKSGKLLNDAAENLFYAMNGKTEITKLVSIIEKQQRDLEEVLGKGGTQPRVKGNQDGVTGTDERENLRKYFGTDNRSVYETSRKKTEDKK